MSYCILAAEQDRELLSSFRSCLIARDVDVITAASPGDAVARALAWSPVAALIGTGFGDATLKLVKELHRELDIRIVVAGRVGDEELILQSLEAGAVGFAMLPIPRTELRQRLYETLCWRPAEQGRYLTVGPVTLDLERRALARPKPTMALTRCEFEILRWLLTPAGRTFTRRQLLAADRAAFPPNATERHVDRHVASLQQKLGDAGALIESTAELGWRFTVGRVESAAIEFPLTNINYEI